MLCDDYVSAALSNLYDVYFINEIRPLGGIYPMLCKTLFPNFFSTSMPLVLNGILVGVLGATMLRIMAQIGTAELPSWLLISGFLCHPAINDFTAWNSVGFHIVACIMALFGVLLAWRGTLRDVVFGSALLAFSTLSYQLFMPVAGAVALLLFVHHGCLDRHWPWHKFLCSVLAFGMAAGTFVFYSRVVSPFLFATVGSGGIAALSQINFSGAFHQTIALYLNIFCAPLCYWLGIEYAMRAWYIVAALVYAAGAMVLFLACRRQRIRFSAAVLLMSTWFLLPFATATPLWLSRVYTDWRISMMILFPLLFVIGSMFAVAQRAKAEQHGRDSRPRGNRLALMMAISVLVVLAASTMYDCRLRVDDFRHDQSIIAAIRTAPARLGIDKNKQRVLFLPAVRTVVGLAGDERLLNEGSQVVIGYSTLSYGTQFPFHMLKWNSINADLCDQDQVDALKGKRLEECMNIRVARLPYVLHFPEESTSVVVGTEQHKSWVLLPELK